MIDQDADTTVEVSGSIRLRDLPMGLDQIDIVLRDCLKEPLEGIASAVGHEESLDDIASALRDVAAAIRLLATTIGGRA